MKKKIIVFAILYFIASLLSALFLFAWNSFGGWASMNFFQKAITVFFMFPGSVFDLNRDYVFVHLLVNTAFWTLVFCLIFKVFSQLRKA